MESFHPLMGVLLPSRGPESRGSWVVCASSEHGLFRGVHGDFLKGSGSMYTHKYKNKTFSTNNFGLHFFPEKTDSYLGRYEKSTNLEGNKRHIQQPLLLFSHPLRGKQTFHT